MGVVFVALKNRLFPLVILLFIVLLDYKLKGFIDERIVATCKVYNCSYFPIFDTYIAVLVDDKVRCVVLSPYDQIPKNNTLCYFESNYYNISSLGYYLGCPLSLSCYDVGNMITSLLMTLYVMTMFGCILASISICCIFCKDIENLSKIQEQNLTKV